MRSPLSLRVWLLVPFVLLLTGTVGLVGYLSYRSGQQSVENLAFQLIRNLEQQIIDETEDYLDQAQAFNQNLSTAIAAGAISVTDLDQLHRYLILQHQQHPELTTLRFATPQGDFRASHQVISNDYGIATALNPEELPFEAIVSEPFDPSTLIGYSTDESANLGRYLHTIENFDARDQPWYQQAIAAGRDGWTEPFQIGSTTHLALNNYLPIYDEANQLLGVSAANVSLDQLDDFLQDLPAGQSGEIFIIERSSELLIADSTEQSSYVAVGQVDFNEALEPADISFERRSVQDSPVPVIQQSYAYLRQQFDALRNVQTSQQFRVSTQGDRLFITVDPFRPTAGIDWLVVTVVPESDFTTEIQQNVRNTVLLCLLALGGAIALGLWTTRRIVRPIVALSQASQALAAGDFAPKSYPSPITEVEALRRAFFDMAEDLSDSIQSLRDSEQKFITLMDQLPVGVGIFDVRGNILWSNRVAQRIFGRSPVETEVAALSTTYQVYRAGTDNLYPVEELPAARSLRGETVHVDDVEIVPYAASTTPTAPQRTPLEVRSAPVYNAEGEILYAIAVFQDISDRKQVHQLRTVFNESTDALFLVQTETGLTVECNDRAVEMFEASDRQQLIGITGHNLQKQPFTPAELEGIRQAIDRQGCWNAEVEYVSLRGRKFWGALSAKEIQLGEQVFALVRVVDISDRKAIELALRQSETRFQTISDTSPANIYCLVRRTDGSFYFEHISRAIETIQGLSAAAILEDASLMFDSLHPDDRPGYEAAVQRSLDTMEPFHHEWRIITTTGQIKWLQGDSCPIRRDNGEVAWYGTALDITDRKQAELALQHANQQLQAFWDYAPTAISLFDIEGRYLRVNPTWSRIIGRSAEAIVGQTFADLFDEKTAQKFRSRLERVLVTGQPLTVEDEIEMNGELKTFESILFAFPQGAGEPPTFWSIALDVTDRKRAETQLREEVERRRAIEAAIVEGIAMVDLEGRQIYVSPAFCDMLGWSAEELLGATAPFVYWPPEDIDTIFQVFAERMGDTQPTEGLELRFMRRNGERFDVLILDAPLRNPEGQIIAWLASVYDISDRKAAERALRESEAKFSTVFHANPAPAWIATLAEGRCLEVNAGFCHFYGLSAAELLGRTCLEINLWANPAEFQVFRQQLQSAGKLENLEVTFRVYSGETRTVLLSASVNRVNGEDCVIGVLNDISDRKAAELELQRLNAQLEQLAAHDSLTQLANRRQWQTTLDHEWQRHKRDRRPLSLIMLDIDHFKAYNDHFGHPAGDDCLVAVAQVLQTSINRPGDLVARYGGEEFCLLLPETDERGAVAVAERIQRAIYTLKLTHPHSSVSDRLTVSLGIVVVQEFERSRPVDAIAAADAALYTAKHTRNSYSVRQLTSLM